MRILWRINIKFEKFVGMKKFLKSRNNLIYIYSFNKCVKKLGLQLIFFIKKILSLDVGYK